MINIWNNSLLIGDDQIDQQHKQLFEIIEHYFETCKTSPNNDEIIKVVNYLEDYVRVHFSYEETIQKKSFYPDYEKHKQLHKIYKDKVKDLKANEIIMAASTNDPYMSIEEAIELQSKLNIGMKIMENAGHINAASGFGKLDCARDWIKREDECEINEELKEH